MIDKGLVVLDAIDKEQDGLIDHVDKGDISLEKAQDIYNMGLRRAGETGYIKHRVLTDVYRTSDNMNDYVLNTYNLAIGDVYNRLAIIDRLNESNADVVLDEGADGNLDKVGQGSGRLQDYQVLYSYVLAQGLREGQVMMSDGKLLVVSR
jgi:hypothetical protein